MEKFDNILILSDLDGTFIAEDGNVPNSNIEAIKYFEANGGKFSFATGRMHNPVMNGVPCAKEIANALGIMVNGAYLYDFQNDKSIYKVFLDKKLAFECANFVADFDNSLGIRFSTERGIVIARIDDYIKKELNPKVLSESPIFENRPDWNFDNLYKVVIRGNFNSLCKARDELEKRYSNELEIVTSGNSYLEFQKKGCTKGSGLNSLRKYYKEEKNLNLKIFTVGDFENDLPMHREADVAVCPSNACENVKSISDMCLCHCNDGVIANLIERL